MSIPDPSLLSNVGQAMADAAPEGWETLTLDVTAAANMTDVGLNATMPDGSEPDFSMRGTGIRTVSALRKAMYEPETGTWYNATFVLNESGEIKAEFDYENPPFGGLADDDDPGSSGDAEPDLLIEDQKMYPRTTEHLPDWHPARSS